ncbi:TPA: ABC transporter permease [bacterium]|nr:ABC transporter permease [bacterium]
MKKKKGIFSKLYIALIVIFFYIPLVPLVLFSFNESQSYTVFTGFSLRWYEKMLVDNQLMNAIMVTITIAILATVISTIIGTFGAIAISKLKRNRKEVVLAINNIPILNPDIVTAIGLLLVFVAFNIPRGYITMLLAHIGFCVPYVIITVYPKLNSLDPNLVEAALDLGATPTESLTKVLLPQLKPSILAAASIAFTMSFDDFAISLFTAGPKTQNISTYLYSTLKKQTLSVNAFSTIIIAIITVIVIVRYIKDSKKDLLEEGR